jgi:hypothetical protein
MLADGQQVQHVVADGYSYPWVPGGGAEDAEGQVLNGEVTGRGNLDPGVQVRVIGSNHKERALRSCLLDSHKILKNKKAGVVI